MTYGPALASQVPPVTYLGFVGKFLADLRNGPDRTGEIIADALFLGSSVGELREDLRRHYKRVEDANWRSANGPGGIADAPLLAIAAGYNGFSLTAFGDEWRSLLHA